MTIKIKATLRDFVGYYFSLVYGKRGGILCAILGFGCLIWSILSYANICEDTGETFSMLILGLILVVLLLLLIYLLSVRQYKTNKLARKEIDYEFKDNMMSVKNEGGNGTVDLNSYYKITEFKNLFLLYSSNRTATYLPKKDMTPSQIEELRGIFKNLQGVKLKLKQ